MNWNRLIYIDIHYFMYRVKKSLIWLLLAVIAGTGIGALAAYYLLEKNDNYRAVAAVVSLSEDSYAETSEGLVATRYYSDIIKSRYIAERAKETLVGVNLTTDEIYDMLSTDERVVLGTTYVYENPIVMLHIYADYKNAEESMAAVNAVANAFVEEINSFLTGDPVKVLDYAVGAEQTYFARKYHIAAVAAGAVGGLLGYLIILLGMVMFTPKLKTVRDVELYGQLPVLGVIPDLKE